MGFMRPVAEHMVMYHVETDVGTELVPESVCGKVDLDSAYGVGRVYSFCQDPESCKEVVRKEGWYSRLSAPGYLDATDWHGPFETSDEALTECQEFHEVDGNGDEVDHG